MTLPQSVTPVPSPVPGAQNSPPWLPGVSKTLRRLRVALANSRHWACCPRKALLPTQGPDWSLCVLPRTSGAAPSLQLCSCPSSQTPFPMDHTALAHSREGPGQILGLDAGACSGSTS